MSSMFAGSSVNVLVQKLVPGTDPVSGPATYSSGPALVSNNQASVNVDINSHEGVIITLTDESETMEADQAVSVSLSREDDNSSIFANNIFLAILIIGFTLIGLIAFIVIRMYYKKNN